MAQLLDWLALAGARTSAGDPVSTGTAWFYEPGGGTTTATVYDDVDGTVIATQPVTLDAGGRATVYVTSPVRVVIQDSTGADVSDCDQADVHRAEAVQVDNAYWSDDYLGDVLTKLGQSFGGVDGKYQESSGATARTIQAKFEELSISVKDFGAKGDGLTVDTTAIQAAINRCGFLGGGEVYFPPGTYIVDQLLSCSTSGVSLRGAGRNATILKLSSTTLGSLSFSGCSGFYIRDLQLVPAVNSSGTGITLATCTDFKIDGVYVHNYYVALAATASTNFMIGGATRLASPSAAAAAGRSMSFTDCGNVALMGAQFDCFGAASRGIELLGSTSNVTVVGGGGAFTGTSVRFDAALTGTAFRFVGVALNSGNTTFSFGATIPPLFYQAGCGVDGYTITVATGATAGVPDLSQGRQITIAASSGGAGTVTVPDPSPLPDAATLAFVLTVKYKNAAGGAVTWAYSGTKFVHVGTAVPAATAAHTIIITYLWDGTVFREICRGDTVT